MERIVCLVLTEPADQKMSGDNKIKCYNLVLKIIGNKDGVVELTSEDITFLKNVIKAKYGVLVVGEAMFMLEGKDIGIVPMEVPEPVEPKIDTN